MAIGHRLLIGSSQPTKVTSPETGRRSGQSVLIRNRSDVAMDVGGADVTAGAGYELEVGDALPADLIREDLYVIAASGSSKRLDVLEVGIS